MGLDVVELFMQAEETFDIEIDNNDAGSARIVGDLYNLVLKQLEKKSGRPYKRDDCKRSRGLLPCHTPTGYEKNKSRLRIRRRFVACGDFVFPHHIESSVLGPKAP